MFPQKGVNMRSRNNLLLVNHLPSTHVGGVYDHFSVWWPCSIKQSVILDRWNKIWSSGVTPLRRLQRVLFKLLSYCYAVILLSYVRVQSSAKQFCLADLWLAVTLSCICTSAQFLNISSVWHRDVKWMATRRATNTVKYTVDCISLII